MDSKKGDFAQIFTHWGTPEIDLFENRLNICSSPSLSPGNLTHNPASCLVDAFTISWNSLYFYAFPPFCQIHRRLQKILEEQVPQRIMILPFWPTQVWWPQPLKLLIAIPFVLPKQEDLLSLSHSPQTLHPLRRKLTMLACLQCLAIHPG